jgi:hypothetical protein
MGPAAPPMPACRYDVLRGSETGDAVTFARVGDSVYHKWSCDYHMPGVCVCTLNNYHTCKLANISVRRTIQQ